MPRVNVLDTTGRKTGTVELPKEIFAKKASDQLLAQAIRVYRTNKRQVSAKTKSRGEVVASKRKIWRQKGTGRARHGSRNAPIFVKGAIAHGPRGNQSLSLKLTKKMKRLALFGSLTAKLSDKKIFIVEDLLKIKPKTKAGKKVIDAILKKEAERSILLVLPKTGENCKRAFSNLKNVTLTKAADLNAYKVLRKNYLFLEKEAIESLKETFLRRSRHPEDPPAGGDEGSPSE